MAPAPDAEAVDLHDHGAGRASRPSTTAARSDAVTCGGS
jgi:hypothetical protein